MLNGSGAGWNLAIAYAIRRTGFFASAQPFNATVDRRFASRSDSHDPPTSGRHNPLPRLAAVGDNAATKVSLRRPRSAADSRSAGSEVFVGKLPAK